MRPRRALVLLLALAISLLLPGLALAHANLVRSEPASGARLDKPPARIQAWFSEAVEPGFSELQVLDASGKQVDSGDSHVAPDDPTSLIVSLPASLPDGAYTVSWNTLSHVDGHAIRGLFTFGVGTAAVTGNSPAPTPASELGGGVPLEAVARYLLYLTQTFLLGSYLVAAVVLRGPAVEVAMRSLRPSLRLAAGLLIAATLLALLVQTALASSQGLAAHGSSLMPLLLGTRYGTLWLVRMALAVVLFVVAWTAPRRRLALWAGVALAAAILLVNSLNSHSAAVTQLTELAVAVDWLHQAAVSVWVGGLFTFAMLLWRTDWAPPATGRLQVVGIVLPRFSTLALDSVPLLILSGTYLSLLHVGSWAALLQTLYGELLLAKIALLALMLVLGAFHFLRVQPRLTRLGRASASGGGRAADLLRAAHSFRRTLLAEAGLGALVLLAAGFLTSVQPAWQAYAQLEASRPIEASASADDLSLKLTIDPGRPGLNTYTLAVLDQSGRPAAQVEKAVLRVTFLDRDLGETEVPLQAVGDGNYQGQGGELGVSGQWQALMLVRRQGRDDARTAVRFAVAPPAGAAGQPTPLSGLPSPDARTGLAAVATLGGIGLAWFAWRHARGRVTEALPGLAASLVVVAVGLYVGAQSMSGSPSIGAAALRNPILPDATSIAKGKAIYQQDCAVCHGDQGRGDGPESAALRPPPADLRVHMAAGHTDAQLFNWITNGVPGTAMPAWQDKLTEEERWNAINYIRTAFTPQAAYSGGGAPSGG